MKEDTHKYEGGHPFRLTNDDSALFMVGVPKGRGPAARGQARLLPGRPLGRGGVAGRLTPDEWQVYGGVKGGKNK
jgi:hypothetical protein